MARLTRVAPRWALVAAILSLAGCAERPVAVSPFFETQPRWETAAHWRALADRTAEGLVATAQRRGLAARPFHVRAAGLDTAFGQAFEDLLTTALVSRGAAVVPGPVGAVVVNVAAQPIARSPRTLRSVPGIATAAGVAALGGDFVADGWPSLPEAAVLGGLTALLDSALMSQPTSEVVVTISVMDATGYLYRASESYYVRRDNLRDYVSAAPPPVPFATLPPARAVPVETRRLAVVGPPENRP